MTLGFLMALDQGISPSVMACLHGAIVAAIGRATDRRDRLHVCLHDPIVAAIGLAIDRGLATDRRDRSRDRLHVCLHGAIAATIAATIAPCKHAITDGDMP